VPGRFVAPLSLLGSLLQDESTDFACLLPLQGSGPPLDEACIMDRLGLWSGVHVQVPVRDGLVSIRRQLVASRCELVASGELAIAVRESLVAVRGGLVGVGRALVGCSSVLFNDQIRKPLQIAVRVSAISLARPLFPDSLLRHRAPIPRSPSDVVRWRDA
jgi:hypothetical protein